MSAVEVDGRVEGAVLHLTWSDARSSGTCRFDHLPGTHPEWLGAAEELLAGASRRQEPAVLEAVAAWGRHNGYELGIWSDGAAVETL